MSLSTLTTPRSRYNILAQNPDKCNKKSKRRTSPHALTLEFADLIITQLFLDIQKVLYSSQERSMWLLRFPILYGTLKDNFKCHRSELEHYIEYARAWAIQAYAKRVSHAYTKTPAFRRKISHFSQVKMRNILYAMSNTHSDSMGIFKIMCGHTIIWRDTMYNTSKSIDCKKIEEDHFARSSVLMVNVETQTLHPPTNKELYYDLFDRYDYLVSDNRLRKSFGIHKELDY